MLEFVNFLRENVTTECPNCLVNQYCKTITQNLKVQKIRETSLSFMANQCRFPFNLTNSFCTYYVDPELIGTLCILTRFLDINEI